MPEPRKDMLPDPESDEIKDQSVNVSQDVKTPNEVVSPKEEGVTPPEVQTPTGVKTPDSNLYAALKEERQKRKELEQKLQDLESSSVPSVEYENEELSDEGRVLKQEIISVRQEMKELKETEILRGLHTRYPVLQDKQEEFNEFRSDYPGLPIDKVAKLFLVEHDLLTSALPERKGLERSTAGDKTPTKEGHAAEDLERLMKDNPKLWLKKLQKGEINPDKIY